MNYEFNKTQSHTNFYMKYFLIAIFSILIIHSNLFSQIPRILIDEDFSDWQNIQELTIDPSGDNGASNIDFGRIWAGNDSDHLFIRIEVGAEINLQDGNDITLYIDTDNNASTGIPANGIGAELAYNFGDRSGEMRLGGVTYSVSQNDVGLVSAPTVTSTEFEIALKRNVFINGQALFPQNDMLISVIETSNAGNDKIPDAGGIAFTFDPMPNDSLPTYSLTPKNSQDLRVLSYNVLSDNMFESNLQPQYQRIFQAVNPAIIGFQEIYSHSSAEVAAKMETFLPSGAGEQWYHASVSPDIIVASRFPVTGAFQIPNSGNGAFLIDLRPTYDHDLLFFSAHPPCCSNNSGRQEEMDAMMAFLRDAQNGQIAGLTLAPNSPVVIVGDMNLVGFKEQQQTLITGNILDNANFGPDFSPDWGMGSLKDASPFTTDLPMAFTWYSENSSFSPGRLDYVLYTGSILTMENSFSLFTPAISPDTLAAYNLQANDVVATSDHLPVVVDFSFETSTAVDDPAKVDPFNLEISPNPASLESVINYQLPQKAKVEITLYSIEGKLISVLESKAKLAGEHSLEIPLSNLTNGVYVIRFSADGEVASRRFVIRK